jgi:hypothetical protein
LGITPSREQIAKLQRVVCKDCGVEYGSLVIDEVVSAAMLTDRLTSQQEALVYEIMSVHAVNDGRQGFDRFDETRARALMHPGVKCAPSNMVLHNLIVLNGAKASKAARAVPRMRFAHAW